MRTNDLDLTLAVLCSDDFKRRVNRWFPYLGEAGVVYRMDVVAAASDKSVQGVCQFLNKTLKKFEVRLRERGIGRDHATACLEAMSRRGSYACMIGEDHD